MLKNRAFHLRGICSHYLWHLPQDYFKSTSLKSKCQRQMILFIYGRLVFLQGKNSWPQTEAENPAASNYHPLISVRVLTAGVGPTQTTGKKKKKEVFFSSSYLVFTGGQGDRENSSHIAQHHTPVSAKLKFSWLRCQCKGFALILHKSDIRIGKPGPSGGEIGVQ